TTVSSTIRYPPATVNKRRKARSRSLCPDQVPWSIRVKRSWETLSNASAMAEQGVMLVKYSKAMRYIHSGSGIESHLPSESLCLFLWGLQVTRTLCYLVAASFSRGFVLARPLAPHVVTSLDGAMCKLFTGLPAGQTPAALTYATGPSAAQSPLDSGLAVPAS